MRKKRNEILIQINSLLENEPDLSIIQLALFEKGLAMRERMDLSDKQLT